jgi:PAS domain S-box-containing protein
MRSKSGKSPLRQFLILITTIFLAETAIMALLHSRFAHIPIWIHSLVDPLLLVLVVFPFLYFLSFRPIARNRKKLRRTDRRLKRKNLLLEDILNGVQEGVGVVDRNEIIIFCNPAFGRIFDETPENMKGRNLEEYFTGESFASILRETESRKRGKISYYEIPIVTAKGNHKHIQISLSPRLGWDGCYNGVFGVVMDITERKRIEEELRASEERYRALFEMSSEGIIVADIETKEIVLANPAICLMLGYTEYELTGMRVTDVHPREDLDKTISEFEACARGDKILATSIPCVRKDGTVFYTNATTARIVLGNRTCIVGFFTDITELKKIDSMKHQFISTVSHELRTPLTSIHSSLCMINKGKAGKFENQAKRLLEIAYRNSERLKALVDDILDLQKLEAGKMEFDMKPLRLRPLIEQSLSDNEPFGRQFDVDFVLDEGEFDIEVSGDSQRLAQVMSNLLSNAAKFSPKGSSVEISVDRREQTARVSVSDRGPGIPEAFRDRIFQKFAQAESIFDRETRGTGLGLSISKAIIEEHGGEIGFETEIGEGTTFYFELPERKQA